ncbi:amino acid adenylation domain-containing protein [Amycolatopsis sp.]|jgi:amino acid adenylation domain-containing protein|uniref:non-ribosomal peptide synthetase n=1 Tax=Amycolatopsis sp. TaxID=37632 RepID=UPI002DF8802A|nr:amino acid adenylation domain-containing protein [Amycolatopsis sp.]
MMAHSSSIRPRGPRTEEAPLSFAQQRLWFLHELDPGNAGYNIPSAHRIRGPLDVDLLRRALDEIVRRHQVLRSTLDEDGGGRPVQRVRPPEPVKLPVTTVERVEDVATLARELVLKPFDLRRDPMLRADLFALGPDDHVLLLCLHHVVADQWTLSLVLHELSELYTAFLLDLPSPLAEPPIQYADFATWQREGADGDALEAKLLHWRGRLASLEPLELRTDHPRPAVPNGGGARRRAVVPPGVLGNLRELAADRDVTLFVVVEAALSTLLARYTGQSDIAIGAAIASRDRPELERLVGFFVNTVVLRNDLSGDPAFTELLGRVRETVLDAHENQDVPFERLVEVLEPDRDLSRPPLVNVVLSFLNTPADRVRIPGSTLSEFVFDPGVVKFELDVMVLETDDGLVVDIDYRRDLFDAATIQRLLGHFVRLLTTVAENPGSPLSSIELLAPEDEQRVLAWGNATTSLAPEPRGLSELFTEQVALRPDAPALREDDRVLTYRELDERADRFAGALRSVASGQSPCVGVCLDRSIDQVVALLAVLRAGGHYLPLDPGYPGERLRYMLEDAGAELVVTSQAKADGWAVPTLLVDGELPAPAAVLPAALSGPEDLAYVMYTSGSTGRPKGVRVPHRAVARLVRDTDYVRIGETDRVAHASSISFDAATFEIWGALLNGAELVILPRETIVEPAAFARSLRGHAITVLWMTSSLFNHTVREVPDAVAGVGTVLIGGEALDVDTVRTVLRDGAPGRLLNGYGPTENTTFTTTHHIAELADNAVSVPIGKPIRGTRCYVLDDKLALVPPGAPGELCVAGLGLAHGYLGDPALMTGRFVTDPFGTTEELLYRTGDVVRWRNDGVLEFLGRRDDQVKIRGYRIELGEIEERVKTCAGVGSAVVLVSGGDTPRLIAYVVPGESAELSTVDLQNELTAALPGYMVPSGFVVLDEFPLTVNGKLDRANLARLDVTTVDTGFIAPRTETEATVCAVLRELLGVDRVGATDHFFQLGGNSLLATRAVSRLRTALGVRVSVRTLFDNPTVEGFAAAVAGLGESRDRIRPEGTS